MGKFGDALIARLDRAERWPLPSEQKVLAEIAKWVAFRDSDRAMLKAIAEWEKPKRRYHVDPLAPKISEAFADLIFDGTPDIVTASPNDQERMDEIVRQNELGLSLQEAVMTSSSEGEVWWRVYVDEEVADVPLIDWYSRTAVVPYWRGRLLKAAAFVQRLDDLANDQGVYRHFEVIDDEHVVQVLFRGREDALGVQVDLTEHPDTEELDEDGWEHGLPAMPGGRIVNRRGTNPRKGVSDYEGIEDFLLELNECSTVGHENMRLTAKQKMIVPAAALDQNGNLPPGDVIPAESLDEEFGGESSKSASGFKTLEFGFDAAALILWADNVAVKAVSRVGLTAQFAGLPAGQEGYAQTGTALRIRLIPSTMAGDKRGQGYDAALPHQLLLMQLMDAKPESDGGFAQPWSDPADAPAVERGPSLPEDEGEKTTRVSTAVGSNVMSKEQGVKELHPDWSEDQVTDELKKIGDDQKASAASVPATLFPVGAN